MKFDVAMMLGIVAVAAAMAVVGCTQKSESEPGVAERTGAALDRAAEKTVEVVTNTAGQVVEKTGEVLEKAGAATEKAGANMQK